MAMRENNFNQAIEFAGRCHLIRVRRLGKGSSRTADSHMALGNLYAAIKDAERSLRELRMCKYFLYETPLDLCIIMRLNLLMSPC